EGATFLQRQGVTLEQFVENFIGRRVAGTGDTDEGEDRLTVALSETAQGSGGTAQAARALVHEDEDSEQPPERPGVALASGCLGLVYFTEHRQRLTRETLEAEFPGLLDALVANPDMGFVLVATEGDGAVAIGPQGEHYLADDRVVGVDPLADYPNAV